MEKKIPALVVLAALATEAILVERHHDGVQPPHIETDVKLPVETITTANAGGASGGGAVPTTGSALTQTS